MRRGRGLADSGRARFQRLWPLVFVAAAAVALGGAVVTAQSDLALVGPSVLILLIALLLARRSLAWRGVDDEAFGKRNDWRADSPKMEGRTTGAFRMARVFFYLGVLSIGALVVRPLFSLTLSDWLFLISLTAAVIELVRQGADATGRLPTFVVMGAGLLTLGSTISSLLSPTPMASLGVSARVVFVTLVWFWLARLVLRTPKQLLLAVSCWVVGIALSGGGGAILQLFAGNVIPGTATFGRMTGLAQHVNDLGGMTAVALVPAAALSLVMPARRIWPLFAAVLVALGVVLSGSLDGMMAAALAALAWLTIVGLPKRLAYTLMVGAITVFILVNTPQVGGLALPFQRLQTATSLSDPNNTIAPRLETYAEAVRSIEEDPLVGVGLAQEDNLTTNGFQVHNSVLRAWYESGLLGAVGIIVIFLGLLAQGRHAVVSAVSRNDWIVATSLWGSVLAFLAFGLVAPILYQRYGWMSAALLLALPTQETAQRHLRSAVKRDGKGAIAVGGGKPRWADHP